QAEASDALARSGYTLYRDALRTARDRHGFRFLQPGRVLNPGPRGEPPLLWFFPLPEGANGALAALCARRFQAYLDDQRTHFFEPYFQRFHRQAVLVDVLGALHAGEAAFADTADALAAIAAALRNDSWLTRLLGGVNLFGGGPSRVAFVATKADHVPERAREALVSLLGDLTGMRGQEGASHAIAAIRCTEDAVLREEGRDRAAVRGVLIGNGRGATLDPGEVPLRRPDPVFWSNRFFVMPEFAPPRLDRTGLSGLPHIGLDVLLRDLVGDLL
ncbi:MAG TPA: YcjX family protein, partial [Acetobacteraceae bacterium]|nr:YcjX family protein [Acetobacteraceae bacterium]